MSKTSNKINRYFFGMLISMLSITVPVIAKATCQDGEPIQTISRTVNGVYGNLLVKQIIFRCEDGKRGVGLFVSYVNGLVDDPVISKEFQPDNFAFWIRVNRNELNHHELLPGSDPEYYRDATWDTLACLTSPMSAEGIGENCSFDSRITNSMRSILSQNVVGDRVLPMDIQIAVTYIAKNRWDNNGGPNHNFRVHFDETSLSNPQGGNDGE
ncbi:MAG: hypothetical protein ACXVCP_09270 [Bdellovibrio sp.]